MLEEVYYAPPSPSRSYWADLPWRTQSYVASETGQRRAPLCRNLWGGDGQAVFGSSSGALKVRCTEVETDNGEEKQIHPRVYQSISIDGQAQDIIMMNDGLFQVLIAAGSLVAHARLIDVDPKPSFDKTEWDLREAPGPPFGVGLISPRALL